MIIAIQVLLNLMFAIAFILAVAGVFYFLGFPKMIEKWRKVRDRQRIYDAQIEQIEKPEKKGNDL